MTTLNISKATALTVLVQFVVYIAVLFFFSYPLSQEDSSGKELGALVIIMTTMGVSLFQTSVVIPLIGKTLMYFKKVNLFVFLSATLLSNVILAFLLWLIDGSIWWGGYFLILGILTVLHIPFLSIWWLITRKSLFPKISSTK